MNRPIKFRGWAIASKEMFFPDSDEGLDISDGVISPLPNVILMQFTGLLDKYGREIWEGDVVEIEDGPNKKDREVVWDKTEGCFAIKLLNGSTEYLPNYVRHEQIAIIGNIYENPELLKV